MNINSRFIRLTGNFEIPEDLEPGADYEIVATGSIPSFKPTSNEDGTWDIEYHFKPVLGQINAKLGKTIKLVDKTRKSVKLRSLITHIWGEDYDKVMNVLLANGDELRTFYEKHSS